MNNLVANLNYFKTLLLPNTKVMAMVKAFSYGLGTYDVAKLLEENGIDYLGVANIYEGVELRKAGIISPIMVMKPEVESFDLIIENNLTPAIFSLNSLKGLISKLTQETSFTISLKIDTGMHRIGFEEKDISELISTLKENSYLKIESVFSHLVASEDPDEDIFTDQQIKLFKKIALEISNEFDYPIDKHILNSSGIIRFNNAQFDMVRLGIGLYGISSNQETQRNLLPASTLKSKISQIKYISKGETIGYNRKGIAAENMKIATIPVGYADGLSRKLGNGNWDMLVHGKRAPIVGNVCMDMVMIDVTNIDCKEGEEAFVFSAKNSISKMARCIGTIPYEILTSYSPRVLRVFKF